jgi:HEAT repeat protein
VGRFLELFSDEFDRSSLAPHGSVDPSVIQALAAKLADDDKDIRQEAAYALGILNGTEALPALANSLRDPESSVRGAAATAIGKIGTAENGRALVPLLSDDSANVRNRVLQAIGVLRVKEAGPALRQLYEANRRKEGGPRILAALSRIGDPAQADLFQELVQDPDPERKRLAIEGLGRISDGSRLPAFKKDYQREKNEELRLAYSFALTLLGDRAFLDTIVLSLPSRTLGTRSRSYLQEMGPAILPELDPYLNDPEAEIRATLCDIIASFGDPDAIPRLTPLINDPSQTVADKANRARRGLRSVGGSQGLALRTLAARLRGRLPLSWCRAASTCPAREGGRHLSSSVREGKSLLESGQLDAALAELQKSPDDPDSLYYQGRVWAKKAESAPLPTPPPPPVPAPRGWQPPPAPEFKPEEIQAAQLYERAIAAKPDHAAAHLALSQLLAPHAAHQYDLAEEAAKHKKPPVPAAPLPIDASVDKVIRGYQVAMQADPTSPTPVEEIIPSAAAWAGSTRPRRAWEMVRRKKEKDTAEPLARYGDFLADEKKEPLAAIEQYRQALIWVPETTPPGRVAALPEDGHGSLRQAAIPGGRRPSLGSAEASRIAVRPGPMLEDYRARLRSIRR